MTEQPQLDPQPEAQPRPGAPKVLGVLSIIFGSTLLLFSMVGGCISLAGKQGGQSATWMVKGLPNPEARAAAYQRFYDAAHPATVAQTMIFTLMSAGLLIIGIGQLHYKSWARSLSIYWGVLALLTLVASVLLSLLVVRPANQALFAELSSISSASSMDSALNSMLGSFASSPVMVLGSVVFYAPFPIILMIYFSRAGIREAMQS